MAFYLITGGCGFIRSHLGAALVARGDRVRVLDDLSTGSRANLVPGAELMVGSIEDAALVRRAMQGVDGCFHLAAIASVARCTEAWMETHRVNLSGTIAVLDAARPGAHIGAGREHAVPVVYASSAAVYGLPETCPLEEDAPTRPLSAYGADKLGCELHARVAGQVHGVPSAGLRFFNVYGPRQDPRSPYSGVISIFCERLSQRQPVAMHGDGEQTRDFIHVGDIVAALLAALPAAALDGPVFNVCTGQPTSLLDLVAAIGRVCGTQPQVHHQAPRIGDIRHSVGSARRSRLALGLAAPKPLDAGLAEVIRWLRAGSPSLAEQPAVGIGARTAPHNPAPQHQALQGQAHQSKARTQPMTAAISNQEARERSRMTAMEARLDQRTGT